MNWEELKEENTADLIEYIKYKDQPEYLPLAEAAFIAFTFRFNIEIADRCRKISAKWGYDSDIADQVAERTFERFWNYPFTFSKDRCSDMPIDKCVVLYLFRIARNCLADLDKELNQEPGPYDGTEEVIVEFPAIDHLDIPASTAEDFRKTQEIIDAALSTLTPKHKIIYLTYKAYEKDGFKLPRQLLKELRDRLELSQNSIRVYKNEAFQTVEQYFKKNATE